jgi:hypothetical protein
MACRADLAFFLEYLPTDLTMLDGVFRGEGKMKRADGQVTDLREKGANVAVPWSTWSAEVETMISNGGAGTHRVRCSGTAWIRR